MALKHQITYKGSTLEYWAIMSRSWNKSDNTTGCNLVPFVSSAVRGASLGNAFWDLVRQFNFSGDLTLAECYVKIKESNKVTRVVQEAIPAIPAVPEHVDPETGETIPATEEIPAVEAVTEEVETNEFALAEDC